MIMGIHKHYSSHVSVYIFVEVDDHLSHNIVVMLNVCVK